jgi:hypothetical protein
MREAAQTAEQLRADGTDIVSIAGCMFSISNNSIFPGESFKERGMFLRTQFAGDPNTMHNLTQALQERSMELNKALRSFVDAVRTEFRGQVTYSAGTWVQSAKSSSTWTLITCR